MNQVLLFWEISLALLSYVFYKVMKFIIGNLFTIYLAIDQKKASQWRIFSQKTINAPLVLPVLMTKGPRWNTHAVIGTLGPFSVEESIEIDSLTTNSSARSWIAVVYSFPGYKTIASIESEKISQDINPWHRVRLNPGRYSLGVRYYNRTEAVSYPAIKVDGNLLVNSFPVPNNINDYYYDLIKAKNWFYSSLHYYIFTMLKLRNFLPESFVRQEYLPVGAPSTHFVYNYLDYYQALEITIQSEIIEQFDIFFTLYDRSSLPLSWCIITQPKYTLSTQDNKGYFLLRIRPKPQHSCTTTKIKAELVNSDPLMQQWQVGCR